MKNLLTVVVLSKNEERRIATCLQSLSFCKQILVIDDYSSDKTVKVAEELGAKVIQRRLADNFASQRNFALEQTDSEWVLFVDTDEEVSDDLKKEIVDRLENNNNQFQGYYLKRKNYFSGRLVGEDKILRLGRKEAGKWRRRVHETWQIKGRIGTLDNILHHQTAGSISEMVSKINLYARLHSLANYEEGNHSNLLKIIFFPFFKLCHSLIIGRGLILSFLQSLHSFLAWSELWLRQKKLIGQKY